MTVEMQPEEVIRIFRDEPIYFSPGTRFSYSNWGHFLLGYGYGTEVRRVPERSLFRASRSGVDPLL